MAFQPINNPPTFSVGETVYLRASAEKGFLEFYRIEEIRHSGSGYVYFLKIRPRRAMDELPTVGDRNTLKQSGGLRFTESELITVCEALELKKDYHTTQLANANAELAKYDCDSSGSG